MVNEITSDTLIDVDQSFKIHAGPGAGKTHWLSTHIRQILCKSKRIGIIRKIACISYTNVGAETILDRIPNSSSCVEVATIHSFLYKNIVKPFLRFYADSFGINLDRMKIVPYEAFMAKGYIMLFLERINERWIHPDSVISGLKQCRWVYENGEFIHFKPRYPVKAKNVQGKTTKYFVSQVIYDKFVKYQWAQGYISYDDVIYFSIQLLKRCPYIYNTIVAKYPYFFIDEFQDSIPAIVDFAKHLGNRGCIIGVVGDKAQTIYDFIGASPALFDSFIVPYMLEYKIHGNRRSSPQIVSLLNHIRPDFRQIPINTSNNDVPLLIIGDKLDAYEYALSVCGQVEIQSLAFPNIIASSMKYNVEGSISNSHLIDSDFDSDFLRSLWVKNLIKAVEYAHQNNLSEAWYYLDILWDDRTMAISCLRKLLDERNKYLKGSLYDFYMFLINHIGIELKKLRSGNIKNFYMSHLYIDMALGVKISDCKTTHKTIHKSKGEEYDNVMVIINNPKDIEVLLNPNLNDNPTHRVYYVGMSRAKERLFINVEEMAIDVEEYLTHLPIKIVRL
ncbi:UvrD-helicase domain-containing protein [Bacteroides acidifaciens]|uniref:UvrD-helicase domain-containing protein n=1 Tax=Bacteroides acidifaciens TaxID=85831 RepID=UPI0027147560|nr:ATP-dependent helicase [Bacteroides acidifaciens]